MKIDRDKSAAEWRHFEAIRPRLAAQGYAGKVAAVWGTSLLGIYDDDREAFEQARRILGPDETFLIRDILSDEDAAKIRSVSVGDYMLENQPRAEEDDVDQAWS